MIFNSRDTFYKSKISAIKTDEKVFFRIVVPRSMKCSGANLVVKKENEWPVYYSMFWAGMKDDENEIWDIHFYATTPGLYWYHFELETPWGNSFIYRGKFGIGELSASKIDFQQTVYDSDFDTPNWLKGGTIYQIFPDRFYNSKAPKKNPYKNRVMRKWGEEPYWREEQMNGIWNNDYFGGDLRGIERKLDYIADLGVSCIYLNPIFEAHSNHRYDTADYEKIDPLLGDENDLKSLCKKAKSKGISIILDGVFSHTGCDSKYFNMYNTYNTIGAYNSQQSPYYDWYKFIDWPNEYHSWWGIKLLPEIIEENESYRDYICGTNGILHKWLRCGISGWRLDVADELPDIFLDDLRKAVKDENKDAVIIGEVWEDATTKYAYGQRRRYLLGDQLDSVMNYPFAEAIINFVKYKNANLFFDRIMSIVENYPPQVTNVLMNHIGTHDTARAINRIVGEDISGRDRYWQSEHNKLSQEKYMLGISLMKIASLIQYTLPGVPSLYYGDEVGMQGLKDPFNRCTMEWDNGNKELLKWYKQLGQIRKSCKVLADGQFITVYNEHKTIAYVRKNDDSEILIAINLDDKEIELSIGSEWDNSYSYFYNTCENGVLKLAPYRYALLMK